MITSLIRTYSPMVAGWLLSLPLAGPIAHALGLSTGQTAAGVAVVLGAAYYAVVRWAESRWPALGVLLGAPTAPLYLRPLLPITDTGQLRTAGPETTPAGQGHVRRVNAAGYGGHPDTGGRAEPTTGPQTPSGASWAEPPSTRTGLQQVVAMPPVVEPGGTPPVDFDG